MRRYAAVIAAAVIVVLAAVALFFAWRAAVKTVVSNAPLTKHEETIDLATVVNRVRDLNRLETAAMHVVNVTTTSQTYRMVPDAFGGDELTLLATGDVIAGIDLSRIQQSDVWREPNGTVVLRMPPPQLLVSRLDNRETRVLTRKTGLLRRPDVNLESRVRQHAETSIQQEAIRKGILPLASRNAEDKLAAFLHTLGFRSVRFVETAAPAAR